MAHVMIKFGDLLHQNSRNSIVLQQINHDKGLKLGICIMLFVSKQSAHELKGLGVRFSLCIT